MKLLINLFLVLAVMSFVFLVIGLFKPWVMLWWEDTQNRKKVIKLYGISGILFYAIYRLLEHFS